MELSRLEFHAMNNPVRRFLQEHVEYRLFRTFLRKHCIDLSGMALLDVGCGSGFSTRLMRKDFNPSLLVGLDYMPAQIRLALERRLDAFFFVGDASRLPLRPGSFDATFVFGVLHHIPRWREALACLAKALAPEGVLLIEELDGAAVRLANRLGLSHPKEAAFGWAEFRAGLDKAGFDILEERRILFPQARSFLCRKSPQCL